MVFDEEKSEQHAMGKNLCKIVHMSIALTAISRECSPKY